VTLFFVLCRRLFASAAAHTQRFSHKYYEVSRAKKFTQLLRPILFKRATTDHYGRRSYPSLLRPRRKEGQIGGVHVGGGLGTLESQEVKEEETKQRAAVIDNDDDDDNDGKDFTGGPSTLLPSTPPPPLLPPPANADAAAAAAAQEPQPPTSKPRVRPCVVAPM